MGAVNIWVDYLCINQACEEEKASQVAKLTEIFAGAKRVIAWLGVPDAHAALDFVERLVSEHHAIYGRDSDEHMRSTPLFTQALQQDQQVWIGDRG